MKRPLASVAAAAFGAFSMTPLPAVAQSYPIDCAILLCLSGGWPASVPCARARAEFIRRITPWPIEPPLQIWRCPMSIAFVPGATSNPPARLYDAGLTGRPLLPDPTATTPAWFPVPSSERQTLPSAVWIHLAQAVGTGADIDLSADVFDFVRSIRVWDVRYYSHHQRGRDRDCQEMSSINLGTYDLQGQFRWDRSGPSALPTWLLASRECRASNFLRGVGVEWRDYEGNHGHELVRY